MELFANLLKANWDAMRSRIGQLLMAQIWQDTFLTTAYNFAKDCKDNTLESAAELVISLEKQLGIESRITKIDSEQIIIETSKCPIFDSIKDSEIEWEIPCAFLICRNLGLGICKGISKKFNFKLESWMSLGPNLIKPKIAGGPGRSKTCKKILYLDSNGYTLEEMRCIHEERSRNHRGLCKIYKFCSYNLGLFAYPNFPRASLTNCRYYKSVKDATKTS
jgi:hypothetical protein